MSFITVENYLNARVYTITVNGKELFWVKVNDIQNGLGIKNISDLVRKEILGRCDAKEPTEKQIKEYKRSEAEIDTKSIYASNVTKYARNDIIERIIKNCKYVKECNDGINKMQKENQREGLRSLLGFKENDIFQSKEQSILSKIATIFSPEKIILQHYVLGYYIAVYFLEHKLAIEIDEKGHTDRNIDQEIQRQQALQKELGSKFVRINPDKENFYIFIEIGKLQDHIIKPTKGLTKKTVIDDISTRLLKLEFKSNNSIKTKCLMYIVKKILPSL